MTDYIDDSDFGTEYDEIFNDWYEIEGARKIKELSRQLRTFFNYKTEVIRYRFRSNLISLDNKSTTKFLTRKQKVESLSHEFITLLKKIKKQGHSLEEGIQSLYYENNKTGKPTFTKDSAIIVPAPVLTKICLNAPPAPVINIIIPAGAIDLVVISNNCSLVKPCFIPNMYQAIILAIINAEKG